MKIRFLHAIKMYINWNRTKDLIYCIYILMATFKVHWAYTVKCSCQDKRLRDLMFESHATVCVEECKILVSLAFANNHIVFCWRFARARENNCFAPISMFFSLFTSCTYNSIEWPSFDPNLSKTFEFTELNISIQKIWAGFLLHCFRLLLVTILRFRYISTHFMAGWYRRAV